MKRSNMKTSIGCLAAALGILAFVAPENSSTVLAQVKDRNSPAAQEKSAQVFFPKADLMTIGVHYYPEQWRKSNGRAI